MEGLTLEDAINRSRKLAERHRWNSENTKLETSDKNTNEVYKNTCIQYANQEEQYAKWLEELKSYRDIGTPKELKELKENGAFTGLELAKLAIMQKELKKYKDLEEQGLLVRLPCPIGTTVWDIFKKEIREIKVTSIEYNDNKEYVLWAREDELLGTLNEAVFLTREEAEKKLEEMKNGC